MKVNDGASGDTNPDLKPAGNFCDAYLTYLNKTSSNSPGHKGSPALDSDEKNKLLRIGLSDSPGSKWTFYNRPTTPSPDHQSKSPSRLERTETHCRTRHQRTITTRQNLIKTALDIRREKQKGIDAKGKLLGNGGLQSQKLRSSGECSSEKCLKVSLTQMNINDTWLKLGNDVFKIPNLKGTVEENVSSSSSSSLSDVVNGPQSDTMSSIPSTIIIARTVKRPAEAEKQVSAVVMCQSNNEPITLDRILDVTEEQPHLKDEVLPPCTDVIKQDSNCEEGVVDHVEMAQLHPDNSKLLQFDKQNDDVETNNEEIDSLTISQENVQPDDSTRQITTDDNEHLQDVPQTSRSSEESERSKISSRSLRSGFRHQYGVVNNDNVFKNCWRKNIFKKVSRRLIAERPKRNIGQKRNGEASIGLSRQEEIELNRALYASLQLQRQKNMGTRPPNASLPNRLEDESTEASYDGVSNASFFHKANNQSNFFNSRVSGLQAQRKFASGSNSAGSVGIKRKAKRSTTNSKILVSKKAKTEDFLTYLCLRDTTAFPSLLDFIHVIRNPGTRVKFSHQDSSNSVVSLVNDDASVDETVPNNRDFHPDSGFSSTSIEVSIKNGTSAKPDSQDPEENVTVNKNGKRANNWPSSVCLLNLDSKISESQNRKTVSEQLSPLKTKRSNQNIISNSSKLKSVDHLSSESISLNHVEGATALKTSESSKVDAPQSRSLTCAKRKLEAQRKADTNLTTRPLRPSTRAMTAARADELLMLAKQRQDSPSPVPEVKVQDESVKDSFEPVEILAVGCAPSYPMFRTLDVVKTDGGPDVLADSAIPPQIKNVVVPESVGVVNNRRQMNESSNVSKKDLDALNKDMVVNASPSRRLLRGKIGKRALGKEEDFLRGRPLSNSTITDSTSNSSKHLDSIRENENSEISSINQGKECSSPSDVRKIPPSSFSLFPSSAERARIVNGPSYHPSEEQFEDPIQYIELIQPNADPFGLCRVIPPDGWKVDCCISEELRFTTGIQYTNRLRHRYGPNSSRMESIKKHLESQKIHLDQFPLLNGIQVDLVALSKAVKQCDGLQSVIDRNLWPKVADLMHLPKYDKDNAKRLCQIYCRYLLSYDMLSEEECQKLERQVVNQRQLINCDPKTQCFAKGKSRTLGDFFNIARNTIGLFFDREPSTSEVETEYWKLVSDGERHVAVLTVQTTTDQCGSAFPQRRDSPYSKHGWNFNVLKKNEGSLLQTLGSIEDVTSSTLHVGMLFSTGCWFRHQHHLPFIHYLHTGADIIWYCIPASETEKFRSFVRATFPNIKDLELWSQLSTVMISPEELVRNGISVSRVVQRHGEYMIVFPEVFTAHVCCGYSIAETLYFATPSWIPYGCKAVKVLRESSVPELFSMTKLCFAVAFNGQPDPEIVKATLPFLKETIFFELELREKLLKLGLSRSTASHDEHVECEICHAICFLSAVVSEQDDVVFCLEHGFFRLQKKKKFNSYKLLYQFEEKDLRHKLERAIKISGVQ